jgi:hypothetical protein
MSNENVNRELSRFGSRMKTIAILTLIGFITGIIGSFIWVVGIVSMVISFIIIVFFLLVIGNIKRAGRELNNDNLLGFPLKFILGTIIRFIGLVFWQIGFMVLNYVLFSGEGTIALLAISITLILIGVGLIIVGSILRLLAWGGLKTFFSANAQLFPPNIGNNGRSGANLCKVGCILDMTIFLSFIGDILRIIGYFKLASLQDLAGAPAQPIPQPVTPMPTPAQDPSASFCPNCGSSLSQGARFCPGCGTEIN